MSKTVLLTGVSGYIGLHCAQQLLNAGYIVRGSVRDKAKSKVVIEVLAVAGTDTKNLSIVVLDLTDNEGWEAAATGCDYVMHVASPFVIANPKSEDEMIYPAVEGTLRMLRASKKAGVQRVVLTSSMVSMMGGMKTCTVGPDDWTDINAPDVSVYTKSKTLAEKAAWDFMAKHSGEGGMEMVSINPGGVFGPPLGKDFTGQSMSIVDQMLRGKMPMLPSVAIPMVDVQDVAMLHVQALDNPAVAGKRLIAASTEPYAFADVAQMLKEAGYKGPSTRIAPDFMLRIMALFDCEAKGMLGFLGMNISADNSQIRDLLNWTPRPLKQAVLDSARAIQAISG